jgi:hypothetical protein
MPLCYANFAMTATCPFFFVSLSTNPFVCNLTLISWFLKYNRAWFKYASSMLQVCFKYPSSRLHVCFLLHMCFTYASSMLQLCFNFASPKFWKYSLLQVTPYFVVDQVVDLVMGPVLQNWTRVFDFRVASLISKAKYC